MAERNDGTNSNKDGQSQDHKELHPAAETDGTRTQTERRNPRLQNLMPQVEQSIWPSIKCSKCQQYTVAVFPPQMYSDTPTHFASCITCGFRWKFDADPQPLTSDPPRADARSQVEEPPGVGFHFAGINRLQRAEDEDERPPAAEAQEKLEQTDGNNISPPSENIDLSNKPLVPCPKCQAYKVAYTMMQNREDVPMALFCECGVFNHRWKYGQESLTAGIAATRPVAGEEPAGVGFHFAGINRPQQDEDENENPPTAESQETNEQIERQGVVSPFERIDLQDLHSVRCLKCKQQAVGYGSIPTQDGRETLFCECLTCGRRWKYGHDPLAGGNPNAPVAAREEPRGVGFHFAGIVPDYSQPDGS